MDYEVKNIDDLTNCIFDFWTNWCIQGYSGTDDDLRHEIYSNLTSKEGIERELDNIRYEFDTGWSEDSIEYQELDKMWNYINWYKTWFYEREGNV